MEQIFSDYRRCPLPSADEFGVGTSDGLDLTGYVEKWKGVAAAYDGMSKEIARDLMLNSNLHSVFLRKLQRHCEACRQLALDTCHMWERYQIYVRKGELSLLEGIFTLFGGKTAKEKWCSDELKAIGKLTKKCEAQYHRLLRARELLLVEIEAISGSACR